MHLDRLSEELLERYGRDVEESHKKKSPSKHNTENKSGNNPKL